MKVNLLKKVAIGSTLSIAMLITPMNGTITQWNSSSVAYAESQSIFHLNFDENINDHSGNQIQTKVFGNPMYQNGRVGSSIQFQGAPPPRFVNFGLQNRWLYFVGGEVGFFFGGIF